MISVRDYVKRHHVGGTAYAAQHLPKNSVASKQVKNNSLQGKDVKDGTVGAGPRCHRVAVTRVVRVTDTSGGSPATVFDDPLIGTIAFGASSIAASTVEPNPVGAGFSGAALILQGTLSSSTRPRSGWASTGTSAAASSAVCSW